MLAYYMTIQTEQLQLNRPFPPIILLRPTEKVERYFECEIRFYRLIR